MKLINKKGNEDVLKKAICHAIVTNKEVLTSISVTFCVKYGN